MKHPTLLFVGVGFAAFCACGRPAAPPPVVAAGVLLLDVEADGQPPVPEELRVFVYDGRGPLFVDQRMPETGLLVPVSPAQLGSIALHLGKTAGVVRVYVRGLVGARRIGEGWLRLNPGEATGRKRLLIGRGLLGDEDNDGVPDEVDDCRDVPNADQTGCPKHDAGLDPSETPVTASDGGAPDAAADASFADVVADATSMDTEPPSKDTAVAKDSASPDVTPGPCMGATCKANGRACARGTECSSGFCADGVCCSSTCDGTCMSCAPSGLCLPVVRAEDPPTCTGTKWCNAQSRCRDKNE